MDKQIKSSIFKLTKAHNRNKRKKTWISCHHYKTAQWAKSLYWEWYNKNKHREELKAFSKCIKCALLWGFPYTDAIINT